MTPPSRRRALPLYLAGISVAGTACAALLVGRAITGGTPARLNVFVVLAVLLIASEQCPIAVQRRGGVDTVSLSGIFACALVLQWHAGWAVLIQLVASLLDDVISRRVWWKSVFNAGQYTLSLGAAAMVLHVSGYGSPQTSASVAAGIAVAAGFSFFLVNDILPGIAIALASDEPVVSSLVNDFGFQASVNGAMTVLAPVVTAAGDITVWLVPLLLVPAIAVYRGARVSLEQDYRARHDRLTDLPNRFSFTDVIAEQIAAHPHDEFAVLVMDLDSFKELNDTLGHTAGDNLLRQVAPRVQPLLREDAVLARLGGDEFGILLPKRPGDAEPTATAFRILASLADRFEVENATLDLHASIGVATYPEHGQDAELLLQHADVAMYVAKRNRSQVEVYAPERNQHSRRRLAVLNELRPALRRGQLSVHYQPQVDMRTGLASGAEGLLRWQHPDLGNVSPGEFISLAEHTGFIREITDFVLADALAQQQSWRDLGLDLTIAVNLSPHVLHDAASMRTLVKTILDSPLPPTAIMLELTETAVMADPAHSSRLLSEVAETGIRLSIDDFGTGYSALSYLSRLPVSELKIDRSFVSNIDTHDANRHIVAAITQLAHNLGITVVAEGIERVAEWQTLAALGCHVAQGFLIGRAIPATELTTLLASGAPLVETFALHFGVESAFAID